MRPPALHLVVPAAVEDPSRPSGGNTYDRRLREELAAAGWVVSTHAVGGRWPHPDHEARRSLCELLTRLCPGSVVLVDGLLATTSPEVLVPAAGRLRIAVLVHLPQGWQDPAARTAEGSVLRAAAVVVATSDWTRRWLLHTYDVDPGRVVAVPPGVDLAEPAPASPGGGRLLCVGAVTSVKGHDVLLEALAAVADLRWRCLWVGSLEVEPGFVTGLRAAARQADLDTRVVLTGPLVGRALADRYAAADVLLLPSRAETYGMVVTEALARALPVVGTRVGGVPEALGAAPDGRSPGLLVPPADPRALAGSLRTWLTDRGLRQDLREVALRRRDGLSGWSETARRVAGVLCEVAA